MIHVGKTARLVRKYKGLTQRDAAEALGVSSVYLSYIENNKAEPSRALLDRYRELWGFDLYILAWCLYGDPNELPAPVREPMRELSRAWINELGDIVPPDRRER